MELIGKDNVKKMLKGLEVNKKIDAILAFIIKLSLSLIGFITLFLYCDHLTVYFGAKSIIDAIWMIISMLIYSLICIFLLRRTLVKDLVKFIKVISQKIQNRFFFLRIAYKGFEANIFNDCYRGTPCGNIYWEELKYIKSVDYAHYEKMHDQEYLNKLRKLKLLIVCNEEQVTNKLKIFLKEWGHDNLFFTDKYLKEEIIFIDPDGLVFFNDETNDFMIYDIVRELPIIRHRNFLILASIKDNEEETRLRCLKYFEYPRKGMRGVFFIENSINDLKGLILENLLALS